MNKKTIEQRCKYKTQRLSVSSWANHVKGLAAQNNFANRVIEILTPNVTKLLPDGWQNINTMADAQEWIKKRAEESHFVSIQLLFTNEPIGFIFLFESDSDSSGYDLRFGYLLSETVWGKGLGTELIQGLIKWCKEAGDIKSISGGVERDNIGSIKVLEKTGFTASSKDNSTNQVIFYEYQFDLT